VRLKSLFVAVSVFLSWPGLSVLFTNFNTACWDGSGTRLAAADVANLDKLGIQIPAATTAIAVANLCLLGITFTK
jgi:hypothetical protein